MAEIKIKKKTPIWPWILGGIVILLLLYFFVFANDNADDTIYNDDVTTEQVINEDNINTQENLNGVTEITAYTSYIADPEMDMSHEYSNGALSKLIAATKATADALDVDIEADLAKANAQADEITKNPKSLTHANNIKNAAEHISRALGTIQNEKFPQLKSQYNEVETATANIDPASPTLQQKDAVKTFYSKAGNLLTNIKK